MSGKQRSGPPSRKGHLPTGDLIALGSKSSGTKPSLRHPDESKPGASLSKPGGLGAASSQSGLSGPPAKKPRLAPPTESAGGLFSDPIRVAPVSQSQVPSGTPKPSLSTGLASKTSHLALGGSAGGTSGITSAQIIEVRPSELVATVKETRGNGNNSKADKIIAGALKQLRLSRLKPDSVLNAALIQLVRDVPQLFSTPSAIEGLMLVLKREPSVIFKAKSNPSVYILACQILLLALRDSHDWSESIAKVYVEDSLGDRVWVDLEPCKRLVDNICTLFQTRTTTSTGISSISTGIAGSGNTPGRQTRSGSSSESTFSGGEGGGGFAPVEKEGELSIAGVEVEPRFSSSTRRSLRAHVLQLVNEQLGRHGDNTFRNLLRLLTAAAGYSEVRLLAAQKMEGWIQNSKLGKQCQDLLMTVAVNCLTHSPEDVKVMETLTNIRLKTKLFSNQFVACIKELIFSHPDNLSTIFKGVANNELGQLRSPSNMALLSMMMQTWPDEAAKLLGGVFQDFLTRKEDYLRALRGFLRELVRQSRSEFKFAIFTRSLMKERAGVEYSQLEPAHKERMALSLADLITCSCMVMANMLIREAYTGFMKGEKAMVPQLQEFFSTLGTIQRDAVWWVHTIVPGMFRPQPSDYKTCLRKVLFLEPPESYHSRDNWPPESDRNLVLHLMTEACLREDSLMRVLVIGLTRELPLSPADALDIADKLVARAANAHSEDIPRLPLVERKELIDMVFDITTYRAPANIQLPEDYQPPSLAISKLYWKGWILLLVLSAFNPKTIGALGWADYPTLRGMMEMVMTNTFTFPASMTLIASDNGSTETRDNAIIRELQLSRSEKESILQYENHLASSSSQGTTITDANSFLLNQVTLLKPTGPARRLPSSVIELIKTANRSLKLGPLLCRCRSPDFLLEVIRRQGTLESMKWLTELVESSQSSLEALPTPCLCEFLMASYQKQVLAPVEPPDTDPSSHRAQYKRKKSAKEKSHKRHTQLVGQLQSLLVGPQSSPRACREVLEYFFDKLTLSYLTPRNLALKALQEILEKASVVTQVTEQSDTEDEEQGELGGDWLTTTLPSLPHFAVVLPKLCHLLLQACLVETNLHCLHSYLLFLTQHATREISFESSIAVSQIIVDRFEVILKLFQKPAHGDGKHVGTGDSALVLLLKMFRNALESAIKQSESVPKSPGGAEFVPLTLPTGDSAVLHGALVHATFLLLTCSPPRNPTDYNFLMDTWFPSGAVFNPETYTPLIPDSLLSYLLRSGNPRILRVAVEVAKPSELCAFLQAFGASCLSMQWVLEKLDNLCTSTEAAAQLKESATDPAHLCQCIEVQLLKGVTSGKEFLAFIRALGNLPQETPATALASLFQDQSAPEPMLPAPNTCASTQVPPIPQDRMEQLLLQIFAPSLSRISSPAHEIRKLVSDLESGLKFLITSGRDSATTNTSLNAPISGLIAALHKMVTSSSARRQFLLGLGRNRFSISLFRLVTKIQLMNWSEDLSAGLFKATLQHILTNQDSSKASKLQPLSTAFQAAVRSCAEQLGVKRVQPESTQLQKLKSVTKKACKEIQSGKNPFENESLLRNYQYLVESKTPLFESIVHALVKRAIVLRKESLCIEHLHKIQSFSRANVPIAVYCSPPEVFEIPEERRNSPEDDALSMETSALSFRGATAFSIAGPPNLDLNGLLVDCLELLDPEVLSVCLTAAAREMAFGSSSQELSSRDRGGSRSVSTSLLSSSGQGYLLARLTHESSWPTLISTISSLLDSLTLKEWVNPSTVLDFLWACLHNPCLWQGRVKKEAVVNSYLSLGIDEESQLRLTPSQLKCLLNCILSEAAIHAGAKGLSNGATRPNEEEFEIPPEARSILYSRLPLLMCCYHGNKELLETVVQHLQTHSSFPSLGWQLLVHLYHADEKVILEVDHTHPLSVSTLDSTSPCRLDTSLHHLLSAMVDAQPGQESLRKMANASLLCRKIAIHHPALMIRQLPTLGWFLRGRAHLTTSEFRNRNHRHVFINSFVLLELLQPLVFENHQSDALESFLEPFFEFLKNQCLESKKYQSIVGKFSDFLVQYAQHNREAASAVIFRHLDLLRTLSEVHNSKKSSLKALVECFPAVGRRTKDSWNSEPASTSRSTDEGKQTLMVVPPISVGHNLSHEQVMPFLKKLEQGQCREDILKVLQDLDETSLHSVEILKHFVPELCRIILDPEPASCKLAHTLLLRHLKQSPRSVDELLPAVLSCLESGDHSVVKIAVASIPDLVLMCKAPDVSLLLNKLFLLSTHLSYGCTPDLLQAVQALTQYTSS